MSDDTCLLAEIQSFLLFLSYIQTIASRGDFLLLPAGDIRYYALGDEVMPELLRDLAAAERYIFFEYFIVDDGEMWEKVKEILVAKAQAGVDVRVMYDEFGCLPVLPRDFERDLTAAGARVQAFNPLIPTLALVMNNRDHRKIMVIDGRIAYTGGFNIADEYINLRSRFGHWKDTGLRLVGPVAQTFATMFLTLWLAYQPDDLDYRAYLADSWEPPVGEGRVQAFTSSPLTTEPLGLQVYLDLIWQAERYLWIFTPYLIIDDSVISALTSAAERGVDVRLVLPAIPDHKLAHEMAQSFVPPLLEGGVKIYKYTPGFIHAKSLLVDDRQAVVGTINFDYRSLLNLRLAI